MVAAPLTDLLSPKVCFRWLECCQQAFIAIKAILTNAPVLAVPVYGCPFQVAVDASESGAGPVLLQDGANGVEHPV